MVQQAAYFNQRHFVVVAVDARGSEASGGSRIDLAEGLVSAGVQRPRISSLAKLIVPYRADATVERGVTVTRQELCATSDLARERGAIPLLVVLQFGHEEEPETALRRRILDDASIPYVLVEIDSSWRLSWDRHPNARAAHAIATAIASELRGRLLLQPVSSSALGSHRERFSPKTLTPRSR